MLKVRDIMQSGVVTVTPGATVRELARVLANAQISGVPVLDEDAHLVGVVSASDVVRLAAEEAEVRLVTSALRTGTERDDEIDEGEDTVEQDPYGFFLPESSPLNEPALLAEVPESRLDTTLVGDLMTPVSFTVDPDAPVAELCDFLVRGRIHRAVVVERNRLVGIVTSSDVLRAVADGRLTP